MSPFLSIISRFFLSINSGRGAITYIDLFSGIGGFREGLARAGGFVCVGHCEIDKYADQSYRALFDTKGEWFREDVREADPDEMPDFDLLCGGFPCQSFSIAGHRGGFADPRGTLFFEIARLTAAKRPAYLLLENVPYALQHIRYVSTQSWKNTNTFLDPTSDYYNENVIGVKTGSLSDDYNLVVLYQKYGKEFLICSLGSQSDSSRYDDVSNIIKTIDESDYLTK